MSENTDLIIKMNNGGDFLLREKLHIVARLSLPGILAQISEIMMEYIDAAMVGRLGASAAASIGLVASTTWLFGGFTSALAAGFAVQVAHAVGAGDDRQSRSVFRQGLPFSMGFGIVLCLAGGALSFVLPQWLKADASLWADASSYFFLFALFIPVRMMSTLCLSMVQCTGNMKVPSFLFALMCLLDVIFNFFLIFPTRIITLGSFSFTVCGAGLGVKGAQLGTSLSVLVSMILILHYCLRHTHFLFDKNERGGWMISKPVLHEALRIAVPMALDQAALSGAQIVQTRIIAPLGTIAIAANSFAVTAEAICYMPGFGVAQAATALVGQSIGARRKDLALSFARLSVISGIVLMTLAGALMFFLCPLVFAFFTTDTAVQSLGITVLRIELFAEPLFAAAIVSAGALRGAGDTLVPALINLLSMWGVRLTLAALLVNSFGLKGVWYAMCLELNCRGILYLIRLHRKKWLAVS